MLGPALLGLMTGSENLVTPRAPTEVITHVFFVLAGCSIAFALVFLLLAPETAGASLDEIAFSIARRSSEQGELLNGRRRSLRHALVAVAVRGAWNSGANHAQASSSQDRQA
jgi:hypothetical protein